MRAFAARAAAGTDRLMAFAVILLMVAIVVQVICSALDINPLIAFGEHRFLFGRAVTLNSLLDLQWHLLVIIGLVPAGLVWLRDGHVRVDFLYAGFTPGTRRLVNIAGNLLFALPFLAMGLPAAWKFATRAWTSGEGSSNGGLMDLWLVKLVLPFGFALLLAAIALETFRLIRSHT